MVSWSEFTKHQPELATVGEGLILRYPVGLAFLATVRADGAPRLHPVCPVLSASRLYVFVMTTSPKLQDLLRDGRYALQAFPQPKPDSDEFYVSGLARRVDDPGLPASVLADAKHPVTSAEIPFELLVDRVMHTRWEGFGTPAYHPIHVKWRAPTTRSTHRPSETGA